MMGENGVFFLTCIGVLVLTLIILGIYLVKLPNKPEQPAQVTIQGQTSDGQPVVVYVQQPKPRGLMSRPIDWIALIFLLLLGGCWAVQLLASSFPPTKITYIVSGNAQAASIVFSNGQGGTEQYDAYLPFSAEINVKNTAVSLVAQNKGTNGTITCQILMNDQPWVDSTSQIAFGVVTCNGWVP